MKVLSKFKRFTRKSVLLGAVVAATLGAGLFATTIVNASGADCDNNAVVYCGATSVSNLISKYTNGDGKNSAASIHNIYDSSTFAISSADVNSMKTEAVAGRVTKTGDVYAGDTLVATNALSAGRQNISGSTKVTNNGTTFYVRKPSVSFISSSIGAMVVMKSGVFQFAILDSCGNPIHATPKPPKPPVLTPKYTINKEVAVKGSSAYAKNVNVKPGTHVVYRITVASTGNTPVTNLNVKDKLPAGVEYVANSLKRDGTAASGANFFSTGIVVGTLKNGTSTVFTFEAIVGPKDTPQVCTPSTENNIGSMTATQLPAESSNATVTKACLPKPTYACTSLTASQASRTVFNFTAKAAASNGATITAYNFNFGDNTTKVVTTGAASTVAQHTYAAAGTYNATVSVTFTVPGLGSKTVTAPACATTVTVKPAPAAECTDLKLIQDTTNPRKISVDAAFTVSNDAALTNVSFNWDDGTTTDNGVKTAADHTYQKDGDFNVVATLSFSAGSTGLPASTCSAPVTVTTVMPTCDKLTVDVNNDDKTVTVSSLTFTENNGDYQTTSLDWGDNSDVVSAADITGESHQYTANGPFTIVATAHFTVNGQDTAVTSATCQQTVSFTETPVTPPVTPPTELVNTGAGSVVGLFAAASAFGFLGYRFFLGRRLGNN